MRTLTPSIVAGDLSPELAEAARGLNALGKTPADCVRVARAIRPDAATQREVAVWKRLLAEAGVDVQNDAVERVVIHYAARDSLDRIDGLRVHPTVKTLLYKEFQAFAKPAKLPLLVETDPFATAIYFATLRRFPAGPMDWVISGFPRSWFTRIPFSEIGRTLWYTLFEFGGFRPAFYIHLAYPPRNRALVIEKEVRRAYYRMACSLKLQPEMKGILCAAWFHDPEALRETPHLAALNEPYLKHGGRILTSIGMAGESSGFLKHNPERRKLYEQGQLKIRLTVAMWPRDAAVAWAEAHPELDG